MSESNRDTAIVIGKIVLISVVAALLLGITYVPTSAQLKINEENSKKEILGGLIPEANNNFEAVYGDTLDEDGNPVVLYYRALDSSGNIIGYAFFQQQAGAQGPLVVAGGIDSAFSIFRGMDVLSHEETPGLGAKIVEDSFQSQFIDIPIESLALSSAGGSIDAITGATISSQAVVDALNTKISEIEEAEE
ncbi:MAG: H+/Na+-translocating ferredoxin:NAD+ oxidoreductase subunit [Methanolobus sp.]|jgi:electron transport complex protein RnfG|uniref:Rnf electron transport complex subunit RnfG n=1 Tax=Methanolobus sp. TaxID=1874737 RepID=UPI0024AB7ADE|nr:Rnf electron transport complex subunit RnfG [Methanolobus sp.]MDI3485704.1 H+/Na+-translocating ferredoxin:NAD+ oxidoreductase subunit [Methanolobus sp.]MDK2832109.1 H+/Na+-translocating ferredoxin:NAD+ oxidoreductase subunit [Methanolobus sp.]MDK2938409.1 H+/Na+-translocating ferredoxin:NAD+ oxidoreductase subunit [Methanolobus sp.]